jgi:hypothetical protein
VLAGGVHGCRRAAAGSGGTDDQGDGIRDACVEERDSGRARFDGSGMADIDSSWVSGALGMTDALRVRLGPVAAALRRLGGATVAELAIEGQPS